MRGADLEHVGAVLGEAARTGRTGEDAREVEHAHAGERPRARRQRLGRRVADALDLEQRLQGDRPGVRMRRPVRLRPGVAGAAAAGVDRVLERDAVPRAARLLGRGAILPGAEDAEGGAAVIDEVAMDADPAIAHRVEPAQRIPDRWRLAVDAEIARAAQGRGGRAQIHRDALGTSAAQLPQRVGGEPDRGERCRAGGPDEVARAQNRIRAADLRRRRGTEVRGRENLAQCGERHHVPLSTTSPSTATTPSRLTISGLISASATGCPATSARRESAATARASAATSPCGRLR